MRTLDDDYDFVLENHDGYVLELARQDLARAGIPVLIDHGLSAALLAMGAPIEPVPGRLYVARGMRERALAALARAGSEPRESRPG